MSIPAPSAVAAGPAPAALPRVPAHRVLGTLGMLGAPAFLVQWLTAGMRPPAGPPQPDVATAVYCAVYLAGFAASAVGLRRLRATGRGRGAAVLFVVQLFGLALASTQQLYDALGGRPLGDLAYQVGDFSWPLSHVFMLVVGAAVLRARVWTGWRRWTPLACGLVLPLSLAAAALGGRTAMGAVFCPGTAAAFFALGLAVFTATPADER